MYKIDYVVFRKYYKPHFEGDDSVGKFRVSECGELGYKDRYMDAADEILERCKMYHNEKGYLFDLIGQGEFKVSYKRHNYDAVIKYKIIKFDV